MPRLREIFCKKCEKISRLQPDAMSTYCSNENCGEDDGDYLDDRGVRNVPIRELSQKRQDNYKRRQPKIEAEMVQLSEDANGWRDCGRIRDCLRHLPDMIDELQNLRNPSDSNGAFLGAFLG